MPSTLQSRTMGVLALLVTLSPASAADRDKALAVLEQAIKAHGGVEALTKAAVAERVGEGVLTVAGQELTFTSRDVLSLPDRVHLNIRPGRGEIIIVLNGDKGWVKPAAGAATELSRAQLDEYREAAYIWWLATLAPLLKDDFELVPLPDTKVNGRAASVLKVSRRGYGDATLAFDKQTNLLVRIANRAKVAGVDLDQEFLYSDFKDFDGVKLAGQEIRNLNNRKTHTVKFSSYKFPPKIEDSTFSRP
jgi:hypothetical protein